MNDINIKKIRKKDFALWLENAIPFDVWVGSDRKTVKEARDYIFHDIGETYRIAKEKNKDREALLVILLNLWIGFFVEKPVRISMDSNDYSRSNIYGQLFFKYERMKRLIDSLEKRGYIQRKAGFYNQIGRQTRIWATVKLIKIFIEEYKIRPVGDVYSTESKDLLMLRNEFRIKNEKTKKSIKMSEDVPIIPTEETRAIESNLKKLNTLAAGKKITTRLNRDVKINLETILGEILPDLIKKKITLINTEFVCKPALSTTSLNVKENSHSMSSPSVDSSGSDSINTASIHSLQNSSHSINTSVLDMEALSFQNYTYPIVLYKELMNVDSDKNSFYYTITHRLQSLYYQRIPPNEALFLHFLWIKRLLSLMKPSRKKDKLLQEERPLSDFGIKTLEFEINQKSLHRVFNRGSQNFDKGGRFYGPSYQGMAKNIRKSIFINGHETTELDFSGLHIRMLYHQLGQEFNEDPYTIDDGSLRAEYKLVSLISINAKAQGAHMAVKDALEEGGFEIAEDLKKVQTLMKNYQERHEPIKEFLFSGAGIDLQNKDSQIMEKILMRLHDQGICGLPIHDSVLVEKEHADLLYEIMMKAYGEVMGFEPVLKLAV